MLWYILILVLWTLVGIVPIFMGFQPDKPAWRGYLLLACAGPVWWVLALWAYLSEESK